MLNISALVSFALRNHCSFIGGKPFNRVLAGLRGQLVFFFKPEHQYNLFFMWVRSNFDHEDYSKTTLFYRGKEYAVIFLSVPHNIKRKFLFSFRTFSKRHHHLINYFA